MLNGFENHTAPLSQKELETLLPGFLKGLSKRVGKSNAITSTQIIKGFEQRGIKISDVTVRKLINHICLNKLIKGLVATEKGYYITHNTQELLAYDKSLEGRENQIKLRRQVTRDYIRELSNSQQPKLL